MTSAVAPVPQHVSSGTLLSSLRLRLGVSVAAVAIGVVVAAAPYLSPHDAPVSSYPAKATATIAAHVAIGMAFMLVGLLAWWRLPNNRTGPLMTLAGAVFYTSDLGWLRTPWTYVIADEWRGLFYAVLFHLLLAFPSGRLRSTVDRVFVASFYAWVSLARPFPSAAFYDPHLDGLDLPRNPLLVRGDLDLNLAVDRWLSRIDLAFTAVLVVLLIVHWYRSGRPGRRALTPAFAIAVAVLVPLTVGAVVELPSQEVLTWGVQLLLLLLPFGFLAGLVRTKLARSAVADLVIALQDTNDPRHIQASVARALDDPSLHVGYWIADSGSYVDAGGVRLQIPSANSGRAVTVIQSGDHPVAALVHDEALRGEPELVDAVAAAARLALDNQRLQTELRAQLQEVRASRARIVAAGDAERRRLERDLHDGAQQQLLTLGLALQLARAELGHDTAQADELLAEAERELQEALLELRELARGIHPAILTDGGLASALHTLAARAPVPVSMFVDEHRLSTATETAAYFVVSEALANVAKHAHASRVFVGVEVRNGQAVVTVEDDGAGGVDFNKGSGLRGLCDRVEALGGSLEARSEDGKGTRIEAVLPCA